MGELLRDTSASEGALFAWPLVCGAAVAKRTSAVGFAAGVLQVEVPDRAWHLQLAELESRYLAAFESLLGRRVVERLEFVLPRR